MCKSGKDLMVGRKALCRATRNIKVTPAAHSVRSGVSLSMGLTHKGGGDSVLVGVWWSKMMTVMPWVFAYVTTSCAAVPQSSMKSV